MVTDGILDKLVALAIGGIFLGAVATTVLNSFQTASLISAGTAVTAVYPLLPLMFVFAAVLVLYGFVRMRASA